MSKRPFGVSTPSLLPLQLMLANPEALVQLEVSTSPARVGARIVVGSQIAVHSTNSGGILTDDKLHLSKAKMAVQLTAHQPATSETSSPSVTLIAHRNADGEISAAPEQVSAYLTAATSENTRRAYRADLNHYLSWGGSIPSSPEQVAAYLAAHAETLKAATLRRRIVALGLAHSAQEHPNPCASDLVRMTLRGIWRIHGSSQNQAAPAVREDILAMVRGLSGVKGIRDRALLLLGFAGAFRRSELVGLNIADLEFVDRGLIVHLRRSKTDQEGIGRKVAIPHARGAVCAVRSVREWLGASCINEGALFRPVTRHGFMGQARLSGHAVAQIVKERAAAAGLKAEQCSGHSLRAGLITSAAQAGVSIWKIKAQSGHHTDSMVARYVRDADLFTNNAAGAVL
jgi:site-specific recombinase XerD